VNTEIFVFNEVLEISWLAERYELLMKDPAPWRYFCLYMAPQFSMPDLFLNTVICPVCIKVIVLGECRQKGSLAFEVLREVL
jgi:hypothetical protein